MCKGRYRPGPRPPPGPPRPGIIGLPLAPGVTPVRGVDRPVTPVTTSMFS